MSLNRWEAIFSSLGMQIMPSYSRIEEISFVKLRMKMLGFKMPEKDDKENRENISRIFQDFIQIKKKTI